MENLVKMIEILKSIYSLTNREPFETPSVIIIGDRNSGKSSLLESIVGRSFLPKGPNSNTRCPVELQIVEKKRDDIPEWAVFLNNPECLISDFDFIRRQIDEETQKRSGSNNCISAEPISLRIHSNRVLNISFVDVPGLLKAPVSDHLQEEETLLNVITLNYISNINTIILVTIAADVNPICSEGLRLAKQVDPAGNRTLLVFSKLDLVDPQKNEIYEIICGKISQIRPNIVGVVNTFQREMCEFLKDEIIFLKQHFPQVASKHGILNLIKCIYKLILPFITNYLQELEENAILSLRTYKQECAILGEPIVDYYGTVLQIVSNFTLAYTSTILGPYKELETKELTGGARINYIFTEIFGHTIREINPLNGLNRAMLLTAIRNSAGVKSTIFVPDRCFELLVKIQIKKLEIPSLRCVQLVYEEMEKHIHKCGLSIKSQLRRFPKLKQQIVSIVLELLGSRIQMTNDMVQQLINIQSAYINTGHPDFVLVAQHRQRCNSESQELCTLDYARQKRHLVTLQSGDSFQREHVNENISDECQIIERFITSYFSIVRTAIEDCVPKTIMHFLVNYTVENLQSVLVSKLFRNGASDIELMKESDEIIQERTNVIEMIKNHEKAINKISEIKEFLK